MEELILKKLLKRGKADFMSLRYDLPITTEFKPAFENLQKLKLIEFEKQNNEMIYFLSQDGIDASIKGLDRWAKEKVYNEIKERCFGLTKDTSSIEIKALRDLEDEGFIYESEKRKYKVVPQRKLNINNNKDNSIEKKTSNNRKKGFLSMIFKNIGWWIILIITILGIIEYRFHYIANGWEWILNNIN
ncbi:hypothetical protein [Lutibacter sp. B1]|uniref:hypothetical protein n=1 Tax=Lutibacter sp. B1 TaxID=2725996 RepID=UPI00145773C5|nr:hypothetical protein [Lutibacter sp. B1]NLP59329.1 hypothetical protein [Lutibacter sp. B1]